MNIFKIKGKFTKDYFSTERSSATLLALFPTLHRPSMSRSIPLSIVGDSEIKTIVTG